MNKPIQELDHFFQEYARRFNNGITGEQPDIEGTTDSFSEYFVESSPVGVIAGENGSKFQEAIAKGYDFYTSIGVTGMDIVSTDISLLDEFHAMVKVFWICRFAKKDGNSGGIEFEVIYLLRREGSSYRIFAYITGDEQKALKEHGLV